MRSLLALSLALLAGCPARTPVPPTPPPASPDASPASAPASAPAAAAPIDAGPVQRRGPCSADRDCVFDSPCQPAFCTIDPPTGAFDCPVPPDPGICLCREHACVRAPACKGADDCRASLVERGCAEAVGGARTADDSLCACRAGRCQAAPPPVPCKTYRDCSLAHEPFGHVVPATKVPRENPWPVKPCVDGESDVVCERGFCRFVVWGC